MDMQSEGNKVSIEENDPWQQEALRRSEEQKKRIEKLNTIAAEAGKYLVRFFFTRRFQVKNKKKAWNRFCAENTEQNARILR